MGSRKLRGHFCWRCQRRLANERFSGRGHARHVCRECERSKPAEIVSLPAPVADRDAEPREGIRLTGADIDELGRLLRQSDDDAVAAWVDLAEGTLIAATSRYGFDDEGEDADLPAWMAEERARVRQIDEDGTGRYLPVPVGSCHGEPGVLDAFAATLTDARLERAVRGAAVGRGAFRRVKQVLRDRGAIDLWHRFDQERDRAAARQWLAEEGFELEVR